MALLLPAKVASAQEAPSLPARDNGAEVEPDNNGQDFTRPLNSFDTRLQFRDSDGSSNDTRTERLRLKTSRRIYLSEAWRIGVSAQTELLNKGVESLQTSGFSSEHGLGDTTLEAALIRTIDPQWSFGFGSRLVAPTADRDLGSGTWEAEPEAGFRYTFDSAKPDTYLVPVVRYASSFAGDPSRRSIAELQIAPTLNVGLPDRYFLTLFPSGDIRVNCGKPVPDQTGRLFLPADWSVGRKIADNTVVSLETSIPIIRDYPLYSFRTEFKVVIQY